MSRPQDRAPTGGETFAERVRRQLRTRCVYLQTKEAFLGMPGDLDEESPVDTTIWWCDRTGEPLGPDGGDADEAGCHGPGRSCYEPPVRP